eukprot:scaffold90756_cov63-Phaeocystis_antarctica.AAC.1
MLEVVQVDTEREGEPGGHEGHDDRRDAAEEHPDVDDELGTRVHVGVPPPLENRSKIDAAKSTQRKQEERRNLQHVVPRQHHEQVGDHVREEEARAPREVGGEAAGDRAPAIDEVVQQRVVERALDAGAE